MGSVSSINLPDTLSVVDLRTAEERFQQLYSDSYTLILAFARRRVSEISDADDVVAEVFMTAWRRLADMPEAVPPVAWLYGIASNVVRNRSRSAARQLRLVDKVKRQPLSATPKPQDPADIAAGGLRNALQQLSFDDQEILRLVAWEGLTHSEVGQVLGCSTNAVGIRLHRARQRLEVALDPTAEESSGTVERFPSRPDMNEVSGQQAVKPQQENNRD